MSPIGYIIFGIIGSTVGAIVLDWYSEKYLKMSFWNALSKRLIFSIIVGSGIASIVFIMFVELITRSK